MVVFYTLLEVVSSANPYQVEITSKTSSRPFGMIFASLQGQMLAGRLWVKHDKHVPALPESATRLLSIAGSSRPKRHRRSSL